MSGRYLTVAQEPLDGRRQLEESKRVRDRRSALSYMVSDRVVSEMEVLDELLVGGRLIESVQPFPVQVLDERLFETRFVIGDLDEGWDGQ